MTSHPTPATPATPATPKPGTKGTMSVADALKLKSEDIGVSFGKVMTEEEFHEYRRKKGYANVKVLGK